MNIDYSKLRECDYILCTSLHPISCMIRYKESGSIFNTDIATHVGMLVNIYDKLFIAEMAGRLQINSLKRYYLNQGYWGNRIVCVRRNAVYDNPETRYNTNNKILSDFFETKSYDYDGVLSYILPHLIKQDPDKYYCSEYVQKYAKIDGNPIVDSYKVTPFQIQISERLQDVTDWQIE